MPGLRLAGGIVAGALVLLAAAPGSAQARSAQEEYDAAIAQHLFEGFVIQVPAGLSTAAATRDVRRRIRVAYQQAQDAHARLERVAAAGAPKLVIGARMEQARIWEALADAVRPAARSLPRAGDDEIALTLRVAPCMAISAYLRATEDANASDDPMVRRALERLARYRAADPIGVQVCRHY